MDGNSLWIFDQVDKDLDIGTYTNERGQLAKTYPVVSFSPIDCDKTSIGETSHGINDTKKSFSLCQSNIKYFCSKFSNSGR